MDIPRLRRALLRWFSRAKRPLPWRRNRDAYAIWVSEMMLQQTTVATVIPYYERFMKRFPDVQSLAASDEDSVLALWSGLGYYSRGRNLRLAAQAIVARHDGRFPRDVESAMGLKGVGRYTAHAVTSMAYRVPVAVVDGNVRRVVSRLHAERGLNDVRTQQLADQLLSVRSPGSWNEAMMELGATICTPRSPRCDRCPVASECRGRDRAEHWSEGKPRRVTVRTPMEMAFVEQEGRILLIRNAEDELMKGLYELPHAGLSRKTAGETDLRARYRGSLRLSPEILATVRHSVTHHRIEASILRGELVGRTLPAGASLHSLEETLALPLGGLTRKALRVLGRA